MTTALDALRAARAGSQTGGIGALDALRRAREQPLSLEAQARQLFAAPPLEMAEQQWVRRQTELEEEYGVGNVRILRDDEDRPSGFEVDVKELQGPTRTQRIVDDVAQQRIEAQSRQRQKLVEDIQEQGGALGFAERLAPGLALRRDVGTGNILAERYGAENVLPIYDEEGNVENYVVAEPGQTPRVLEKRGEAEVADIADISGEIVESLPGIIGNLVGAWVARRGGGAGAARASKGGEILGDALGTEFRRILAESAGAEEGMSTMDRLKAAATNVVGGQAGAAVGGAVKGAAQAPRAIAARQISEELVPETFEQVTREAPLGARASAAAEAVTGGRVAPGAGERLREIRGPRASGLAREAAELEAATGVELSTAAATGGPFAIAVEQYLKQTPAGRPIWRAKELQNARQLSEFVDKTLDEVGPAWGSVEAGKKVSEAYEAGIKSLKKMRSEAWEAQMKKAEKAVGNKKVLPYDDLRIELEAIKQEWAGSADAAAEAVIGRMDSFLAGLSERKALAMSVTEFKNRLSSLTKLEAGTGKIVADLDRRQSQVIAGRLKRAMLSSLDSAIAKGGKMGGAAAALKEARTAYRLGSEVIEAARHKVLETAFDLERGRAPDKLAKKLIGGAFSDQEVSSAMRALSKMEGGEQAAAGIRRAVMEEVLESSTPAISSPLSGKVARQPAKVGAALAKRKSRLRALFADQDPGAEKKIEQILDVSRRLSQTQGLAGSQTKPLEMLDSAFRSVFAGVLSPKELAKELIVYANAKRLSIALSTREGRDIILKLVKGKPGKAAMTAAELGRLSARLGVLVNREERLQQEEETETP